MGYIPHVVQYILIACFVPNSLYLLIPYLYIAPPHPLVTTSSFFMSVSLLHFCYIQEFVVFFRFHM